MDDNDHGTHVAGTIGAVGDNDEGVVGVCWDVTIVPLKIWDSGGNGSLAALISALAYAESIEIPILNISGRWNKEWWPDTNLKAMYEAVEAYSGVLVAAAGNEGHNNDKKYGYSPVWWDYGYYKAYPASFDLENIISVAASEENDNLWSASNYGVKTVDLAAPGTNILSTVRYHDYFAWPGTSLAAPHVAGTAALLKAFKPDLSTAEIKAAILENVDVGSDFTGKLLTNGRLNAFKALESVIGSECYIMELEIDADNIIFCDIEIDHETQTGYTDVTLSAWSALVTFTPEVFRLENSTFVNVNNEIAEITYYLGDEVYYTTVGFEPGEYYLIDIWYTPYMEIEVEVLMLDGTSFKYSIVNDIKIVVPRAMQKMPEQILSLN